MYILGGAEAQDGSRIFVARFEYFLELCLFFVGWMHYVSFQNTKKNAFGTFIFAIKLS